MNPKCICELSWLDSAPICAEYEAAPDDYTEDSCANCLHVEGCHAQPAEAKP